MEHVAVLIDECVGQIAVPSLLPVDPVKERFISFQAVKLAAPLLCKGFFAVVIAPLGGLEVIFCNRIAMIGSEGCPGFAVQLDHFHMVQDTL